MYFSDHWLAMWNAKCGKSLLNYCHMSQLEPAIMPITLQESLPGLRSILFFLQYKAIYDLEWTLYLSGADFVTTMRNVWEKWYNVWAWVLCEMCVCHLQCMRVENSIRRLGKWCSLLSKAYIDTCACAWPLCTSINTRQKFDINCWHTPLQCF